MKYKEKLMLMNRKRNTEEELETIIKKILRLMLFTLVILENYFSGDLFNYQDDSIKLAIYIDVLVINKERFLFALYSISALVVVFFVIMILYAFRE